MSQDEQFKVTDRRRRSADAPPTTAPSPEPSASGPRRTGAPPAELSALLIMFASAALMSLGAVTEPGAEAPRVELDPLGHRRPPHAARQDPGKSNRAGEPTAGGHPVRPPDALRAGGASGRLARPDRQAAVAELDVIHRRGYRPPEQGGPPGARHQDEEPRWYLQSAQ